MAPSRRARLTLHLSPFHCRSAQAADYRTDVDRMCLPDKQTEGQGTYAANSPCLTVSSNLWYLIINFATLTDMAARPRRGAEGDPLAQRSCFDLTLPRAEQGSRRRPFQRSCYLLSALLLQGRCSLVVPKNTTSRTLGKRLKRSLPLRKVLSVKVL